MERPINMEVEIIQGEDGILEIFIHNLGILTHADNSMEDVAKSVAEAVILLCLAQEKEGGKIEDMLKEIGW